MQMNEFEIERLLLCSTGLDEKIEKALELCDLLLGKKLYTKQDIKEICTLPHYYFFVIKYNEILIGIFFCYVEKASTVEYLKKSKNKYVAKDAKVGVARSIAIDTKFHRTGISVQMLNFCTKFLFEEERVAIIIVPAWIHDNIIPSARLLEKCKYKKCELLEKPWSDNKDLECPGCGKSVCECNAALYVMNRSEYYR